MKYNLDSLGPYAFEEMIQALIQKEFGIGGTVFGTGKDGGREYIYEGEAKLPFLNIENNWSGYWVIQAKFKISNSKEKDNLKWVKSQFQAEMKKFKNPDKHLRTPDNYIFITNVKLTGQAVVGEIDKLQKYVDGYKKFIPNIHFVLYDDLCTLLENNRDVATSYLSFILPGDVLSELFKYLKKDEERLNKIILTYLQKEFKYDTYSKLEQSGRRLDDNIKIENVFIDLFATESNIIDAELYQSQTQKTTKHVLTEDGKTILVAENTEKRFVKRIVNLSNDSQRKQCQKNSSMTSRENKFVLIGSAGQGKSTLTQFISQLYRAYFINANNKGQTPRFINDFLTNLRNRKTKVSKPELFRIPFRIILTNYNDWIIKRKKGNNPINVISFIKNELENEGDKIDVDDIRDILSKLSSIIIFDGLDEVPASANRDTIISEIDKFIDIELQSHESDSIIIITTRPQGFKDEFNNENFTHLKIVELNKTDCREYLTKLVALSENNPTKKEKHLSTLFRALEKESSSRLMRTPLDATIMATLVKRGGNPPEVKYNLYKDYYTTIFDREREKGVFELDKYKGAINSLHEYLGFIQQSSSEQKKNSAKITRGSFIIVIKKYFLAQGYSDENATNNTNTISEILTERLVMIAELTIDLDNQNNNIIGFPVAPIQEYFASLYLVHDEDVVVIKRIQQISSNSFWRNVLLFMIGYFQNEGRAYLNDHVYSECIQNNEANAKVAKVGSWLAVDVLIENVFSETPNFENIFAKELGVILNLALSNKHDYLLRMPEAIISGHLKQHLIKVIKSTKKINRKLTAWKIIIQIPDLFNDIITQFWPKDNDELVLLSFIINQNKLNYPFFIEKAIFRLKELLNDTNINKTNYFSSTLISSDILESQEKRILIESLFLNDKSYNENINVILRISENIDYEKKLKKGQHYIKSEKELKIFQISENYSRKIKACEQSSHINKKLRAIFEENNIEYLVKLMDFYLNPDKETTNIFLLSLKKVDSIIIDKLVKSELNWILLIVLKKLRKVKEFNEIFRYTNSSDFEELFKLCIITEIDFPKFQNNSVLKDAFLKYSVSSKSTVRELDDFKNSFNDFYLPLIENKELNLYPNLQNEFILELINNTLTINYGASTSFKNFISNNYQILISLLSILFEKNNTLSFKNHTNNINIYQLCLNSILTYIKKEDFIEISSKNKETIFNRLSIRKDNSSFNYQTIQDVVYILAINTVNDSLTLDNETSIIRYIFLLFIAHPNPLFLNEINFSQLENKRYLDEENEISRLMLLFMNCLHSCKYYQQVKEQLKPLYKKNVYIGKYLIKLFSDEKFDISKNIDFINEFYFLSKKIDPENYLLHSKFETIIREKIESKSSDFGLTKIKKSLNLNIK